LTLREGLGAHGDHVIFRDRPIHVAGWAKRFLFDSGQLDRPVASLSGGEQARVLIARLMLQPADLLLLDEPTNDLDIATLEVLEDSLSEFPGACVLITHDRYLMDRLSDRLLYLDGEGKTEYFADYSQWLQSRKARAPASEVREVALPSKKAATQGLSREERKELDGIQKKIERAEAELDGLQQEMMQPEVATDAARLKQLHEQMEEAGMKVAELYGRWDELETKSSG
jgi:ABC transport system ATP-binding/permease protein